MKGIHKKQSHRKRYVIIALIVFVASGGGLYYWVSTQRAQQAPVATSPQVQVDEPVPLSTAVQAPTRMKINKIGVDAAVNPVGLTSDGAMDAPKNDEDIGWYDRSSKMGENRFSILLDGHYGTTERPGVFYRLAELSNGDEITLLGVDGGKKVFVVTEVETLPLEQVDMKKALYPSRPDTETLTIITCDGRYDSRRQTYDDRTVLYAVIKN